MKATSRRPQLFRPRMESLPDRIVPSACALLVFGTGDPDTITIDEIAGVVMVNGDVTATITCEETSYTVFSLGGADSITIIDGSGRDNYYVQTGEDDDSVSVTDGFGDDLYFVHTDRGADAVIVGDDLGGGDDLYFIYTDRSPDNPFFVYADSVFVTDGPGSDTYQIETDPRPTTAADFLFGAGGDDTVTILDGPNATAIQSYQVRTWGGNDFVVIVDAVNPPQPPAIYDFYDVLTGAGDDTLIVADADGMDLYVLNGLSGFDTLVVVDDFPDPEPFEDIYGVIGFESVTGLASSTTPPPPGFYVVTGTSGPDTIIIDELAGVVVVNGAPTAFITTLDNFYHVLSFGGDDSITVIDGVGDDDYFVFAAEGADAVIVHDGPGSDNYLIETDDLLNPDGDGDDTVTIYDGPNGPAVQKYQIRTWGGSDTVTIFDAPNPPPESHDFYDVLTWDGDDLVEVTDALGQDVYAFNGVSDTDSLIIHDDAPDAAPFHDAVGFVNFESVTGAFQ
jgi:hypothetical protein